VAVKKSEIYSRIWRAARVCGAACAYALIGAHA
jgi:hypothetical protein